MNKEGIEVMEEYRQRILDLERANAELKEGIQRNYEKIVQLLDELPDTHPARKQMNLPECDCCHRNAELQQVFDNLYEQKVSICKDCANRR